MNDGIFLRTDEPSDDNYNPIPHFENPIAICAIDRSGTYHLLDILNYDNICVDHWNEQINYISEIVHETLKNCVVQCKLIYNAHQSYDGEWDGEMEIVDDTVLWQYTPIQKRK